MPAQPEPRRRTVRGLPLCEKTPNAQRSWAPVASNR
jgi:hypothetical protein